MMFVNFSTVFLNAFVYTRNIRSVVNINKCFYHFKGNTIFGNLGYESNEIENSKNQFLNERLEDVYKKQVIDEFRRNGHFLASLNPFKNKNTNISNNLFEDSNLAKNISSRNFIDLIENYKQQLLKKKNYSSNNTVNQLINQLQSIYCGETGIEFMHINNLYEQEWIGNYWEQLCNEFKLNDIEKQRIANILIKSETFDEFVALKYPSVKRYGAEGCEPMLVFFDELFRQAAYTNLNNKLKLNLTEITNHMLDQKIDQIVIGMPHRGRLNFLSILIQLPEVIIFKKMQGKPEINFNQIHDYTGDVLSHLYTNKILHYNQKGNLINDQTSNLINSLNNLGNIENKDLISICNIDVCLLPNPSHLEAICPVVCGVTRSKLLSRKNLPYFDNENNKSNHNEYPVLSVQVHGDASFSGQGIIFEQLQFSQFPNFNNFGTIHLIVNNQIGFTIEGLLRDGSLIYNTNIMKSINCPILHVNSSNSGELIKATRFALKYRELFKKDVLIDLICFRKHGHNELDDPTFTNPLLYNEIKNLSKSIPMQYAISRANLTETAISNIKSAYSQHLNQQLDLTSAYKVTNKLFNDAWKDMTYLNKNLIQQWNTGLNIKLLKYVGLMSMNVPKKFNLHKNLKRIFRHRLQRIKQGDKIDWSLSESLAFGSLMYQGYNVRLSGQDVGRGTFSQRHMMVVDQETDQAYIPLNALAIDCPNKEYLEKVVLNQENVDFELEFQQNDEKLKNLDISIGHLEIANSILSEEAVLAFEYGFSIESPNNLVIWESQFGDFFNGAQIIFDTFISSGESKWGLQSALVCLLPHGLDGAGPEHSSSRIERFLQLTNSSQTKPDSDSVNMQVAFPTTPSQYFHLLRRQMIRDYRKPLIVASPKILLRHSDCTSNISEFAENKSFKKIILDECDVKKITKVVFCTGKHYYNLKQYIKEKNIMNVVLIRIEQLCPFPAIEIQQALNNFYKVKNLVWSQEEHRNQGAWDFVNIRFQNILSIKLKYVGRNESCVPAVGIGELHKKESQRVLEQTFL